MLSVKRSLALLLALTMFLVAGCGKTQQPQQPEEPSSQQQEEAVPEESAEPAKEESGSREITDMAGRAIELPETIDKVFSTGPVAAIYIYTFDPELLLGWNYDLNESERLFILPEYHDLPSFGMRDSVNYEAVIAAAPDIALSITALNEAGIKEAEELEDKLGIPVVIVDQDLFKTEDAYRFLGELFNDSSRGDALADYAKKTFEDIAKQDIPEEDKVSIYYGNGIDSLETAPRGSSHAQLFDIVNAINVADLESEDGSRVQISLEQLLLWEPDYIVVNGEPKEDVTGNKAAEELMANPDFATLKAVQAGNVFGAPKSPFSWVDRPPGPNRIIGIRWMAGKLYPDYYSYNVDDEVKEFYSLYYHTDLTEENLAELYNS